MITSAAAQAQLPIFMPSTSGLELLAAAATATNSRALIPAPKPVLLPISAPGPDNPAACLPPKVVKKILELEFVEMSEISITNELPQAPRLPHITYLPPPPPLPHPGHIPVARALFTNGSNTGHLFPREGPRTVGLSGHHTIRRMQLRRETVGDL